MAKAITGPRGATCRGSTEMHNQLICASSLWWESEVFIPCAGLPWWLRWWRICLQSRRVGFDPWVGKIPWRRGWLLTPIFLPGEFHGQRSLAGCSVGGRKESDTTEAIYVARTQAGWLYACLTLPVTAVCDAPIASHLQLQERHPPSVSAFCLLNYLLSVVFFFFFLILFYF